MTDFATIIGSSSGVVADVDTDRRLFVQARQPAFGGAASGSYRRLTCNQLVTVASFSSGNHLAGMRWHGYPVKGPTSLAVVQSIKIGIVTATAITTAVAFDVKAIHYRQTPSGWALTSGVDLSFTGDNQSMRSGYQASALFTQLAASSGAGLPNFAMTQAATAMAPVANGVADSYPDFATSSPVGYIQGWTGTAVGTQWFPGYGLSPLYARDTPDAHPVVLSPGDLIVARAVKTGPATGSWAVTVQFEWAEVQAY